jgi:hypothetical protein
MYCPIWYGYHSNIVMFICPVITPATNHIPAPRKPGGFSSQIYRSLTGKRRRHSERIICRRPLMWFLNIRDNVPMDLKYVCKQYFTYMCFLGFIRYNKTFIAWGYRKYENLFTHEYHIWEYDTRGWIHNKNKYVSVVQPRFRICLFSLEDN